MPVCELEQKDEGQFLFRSNSENESKSDDERTCFLGSRQF
jgi:hypothetical protein